MKLKSESGAITAAVPAGATIFVLTGLALRSWWKSRNAPPTFTMGLPIFGPIIQFLKDPLELIKLGHKKKGGCFRVNFLAKDMIFLVGSEGQEFFCTMDKYLDQAKMYSFTIPIFGPKVLYDTDYSTRMCQLRFIRERLTDDCLKAYVGTLDAEVKQFFREEWKGNQGQVDIRDSMIECLTRTSIRCLMGNELREKMHSSTTGGHSVCDLLHTMEQGMLPLSVFWPSAPIQRHTDRDNARREMSEFLAPILKARRAKLQEAEAEKNKGSSFARQVSDRSDFLWQVLGSKYPDGRPITDEEIVGFLVAAFFGGMHNSSITTSWSTLEIFTRPNLVKELIEEQKAVIGGPDAPFTYEGWEKSKKLRSAVMETLRLHPPLMLLMRTVEADVKFKNYTLPRNSVVCMSPNVGHMLDEEFPNAAEFQPTRFVEGMPNEFSYIPFGGGRRLCKGQEFGFLQIMCVISQMLRRFDVELVDGVTEPTNAGMVLAPSQPCRVNYKMKA